mmetsp:Transcript_35072/g.34746  ORF Transcript_35072/g.34746 Transcript_35072/m.34746 type:complete len:197 (+) Transcript_35072:186-776(+)
MNSASTLSLNGPLKDSSALLKSSTQKYEESKEQYDSDSKSHSQREADNEPYKPASRSNYSSTVTQILQTWFEAHIDYPYPTEQERIELCEKTGLTRKKLRVWLINSRKRKTDKIIKKMNPKDLKRGSNPASYKPRVPPCLNDPQPGRSRPMPISPKINVFSLIQEYNSRTIRFYQKKMQQTCERKLNSFCRMLNKY